MFAIDAAHEALFERGWPHLRVLVSPHPHEKDAAKWAREPALLRVKPTDAELARWVAALS